jgi:hypothetical protein
MSAAEGVAWRAIAERSVLTGDMFGDKTAGISGNGFDAVTTDDKGSPETA